MAYISIKEFSNRAGVSTQAVYQRLDKDLQSYLKIIDKRKMIEESALELFSLKAVEKESDKQIDNDLLKTLQDTLQILSKQLSEKDEQIRRKDQQLEELNQRLAEANKLNENNQILIAKTQEVKQIEAQSSAQFVDESEQGEPEEAQEKHEKRGFFYFLRRKQ